MSEFTVIEKDRESYSHGDDGDYRLPPDAYPREGVPGGSLSGHTLASAEGSVWPGTTHDYWIYTSAEHDVSVPADLLVVLDGLQLERALRLTTVLDNLIARGSLPPVVVVFVQAADEGPGYPIYGGAGNRFVEYDVVGPAFPRFLLEELLPAVSGAVALSEDPDRRGILGLSSGGAAAFNAAWERPDSFRKVISGVGSFVDIGGADVFPRMIRRTGRKPLRVLLQSGENDLDIVFGSWPIANHAMAAALRYSGYDYRFEFGTGGHGPKHLASILPDALIWAWRGWR